MAYRKTRQGASFNTLEPGTVAKTAFFCCALPVIIALVTSFICWMGFASGSFTAADESVSIERRFARFDGVHYLRIASEGYSLTPGEPSNIAFFPAYPVVAAGIARACSVRPLTALIVLSNGCFFASFLVFNAYLTHGRTDGKSEPTRSASGGLSWTPSNACSRTFALLAMGLLPATIFARAAYSESLFLMCSLFSLQAIQRRCSPLLCSILIGTTTGVRPLAVALLPPFVYYLRGECTSRRQFFYRVATLVPVACSGLIGFMLFQYLAFNDALAFADAQMNCRMRPPVDFFERLFSLAAWEPVWSVYDRSSVCYWRRFSGSLPSLESIQYANPLYVASAVFLVGIGAWKKWLSRAEILFAVCALAMAYLLRGYDMCMNGQAWFVASIFPIYIVLGMILSNINIIIASLILSACSVQLYIYAAHFADGRPFF